MSDLLPSRLHQDPHVGIDDIVLVEVLAEEPCALSLYPTAGTGALRTETQARQHRAVQLEEQSPLLGAFQVRVAIPDEAQEPGPERLLLL